MERINLMGKKVVVAGAAGGLGRAMAEAWHAAGCQRALIDITENVLPAASARWFVKNHDPITGEFVFFG